MPGRSYRAENRKLNWLTLPALLSLGLFAYGIILASDRQPPKPSPGKAAVVLNIPETNLRKARAICTSLRDQTGGIVVGQVAVFDEDGDHYSLPCKALGENR